MALNGHLTRKHVKWPFNKATQYQSIGTEIDDSVPLTASTQEVRFWTVLLNGVEWH